MKKYSGRGWNLPIATDSDDNATEDDSRCSNNYTDRDSDAHTDNDESSEDDE